MNLRKSFLLMTVLFGLSACAGLPRMASSSDPLSSQEHLTLAGSYLSHGERKLAQQQYEMTLDKEPRSIPALVSLGNIAFEDNDLKKAKSYFQRALKENPQNAVVINNLAMIDVSENKRLDQAQLMLEKALPTAGPAAPYLLDTLANIAIQQGRFTDAKLALDQADAGVPASDVIFHKHIRDTREKMNRLSIQVK